MRLFSCKCAAPIFGAALLTAAGAVSSASAADSTAIPDFYSNGMGWTHINGKNFEPPPAGYPIPDGPIGNHPDFPSISNTDAKGRPPTPRIGNDTSPLLKPWAAEKMKKIREDIVGGAVPYDPAARCWPAGVPAILTFAVEPMTFLQTPEEVTLVYQRGQVVRHVYMNVPHTKNIRPSWYGESVGHYENGDTLVIDTIGQNDKTPIDVFNIPHTEALHVVERYKLVEGGNKIQVIMEIEDPNTFTKPWAAMKYLVPRNERVGESICQVNNDDMYNQGLRPVPTAAKSDF